MRVWQGREAAHTSTRGSSSGRGMSKIVVGERVGYTLNPFGRCVGIGIASTAGGRATGTSEQGSGVPSATCAPSPAPTAPTGDIEEIASTSAWM